MVVLPGGLWNMSLVTHSASVFPSWLYAPLGERLPCYHVVLESSTIPGAQYTRVCSFISKPGMSDHCSSYCAILSLGTVSPCP